MRIASLLALAFLLPVFAHAALVNINTANAELLDTLPSIGPSKAQAIITYRNEHGPFAQIGDIQNVSGIGPSTYADIQPLITVSGIALPEPASVSQPTTSTASTSTATAVTAVASSVGNAVPEYIPIPMLRIVTNEEAVVSSSADTAFTAVVYDGKGHKRDDAVVMWSFGDGMRRTGASVFHAFYDPGEYLVIVHASTSDGGNALAERIVTVKDASIQIASISSRGISLANSGTRTLDLSLWRLSMGGRAFQIPEDTHILAGRTVLFSSQVTGLPVADSAFLLYPSGEVAAVYPAALASAGSGSVSNKPVLPTIKQPSPGVMSYKKVSEVEPISSASTEVQIHEKAVSAPAATTELAAAGAALPTSPPASRASSVFKSPWTLGLLGIIVLAGSAFIFL